MTLKRRLNRFTRLLLISRFSLVIALLLIGLQAGSLVTRLFVSPASANNLPRLAAVFTPEVQHWAPLIYAWAAAYNVDPNLIATVIQIESCGDPKAVSSSGAQGLFQVMPFHFKQGEDMQDVLTNGERGMSYLARGLELSGGDPGLALAGYNGGHGKIKTGWAGWSAQTRRYYQWGTGIYSDAVKGNRSSQTLQQWLKAGGASLCRSASSNLAVAMK
jgi:soluble lytic murein transglycosylase-like protein